MAEEKNTMEAPIAEDSKQPSVDVAQEEIKETLKKIKEQATEEDVRPLEKFSFRSIIGGDFLMASFVRSQIGLIVLIVFFSLIYVAFRYQCQQDMLAIEKLEQELRDIKVKALTVNSELTERSRESRILQILREQNDTLLRASDQPPYVIEIPE